MSVKELKVTDLTKTYGEKTLFDHLSFLIHEKDRIGLIGINGTGKTSLLNIIAGVDSGDGDLAAIQQPSDYQIGYLSQNQTFDENITIAEAVFQGDSPIIKTVKNYELALAALSENGLDEGVQRRYTQAEEAMNKQDAWTADTNAKIILQKLGIPTLEKKIGELSGGQLKRVSLAQVLIEAPDLLLLDEPTNHLDYETIEWLENFLNNYRGAVLMVTHDRYFLDRVTNRIFELSFGKLYEYKGNYETYVMEKAERERVAVEQEEKRKRLFKQELAWMRAGVQARGTKQQARIDRFQDLKENLHQVQTNGTLEADFATQRLGKKVLEIKEGNYAIDHKQLLKDFNLLIQANDRIGITGKNGAGKSTLLNILAGRIPSNVLLLDEPTNDLDIDTLTILEDYIQTFKGAVIAVSHDRYFLDKTMDKLLVFQGNAQILSFYGTMSEYLANQKEQEKVKEKPLNKPVKEASTEKKEKTKLTYMEQKEWATIEEDITQLETKLETLTEEMNHQGDDFVRLQELQEAVTATEQLLEEKMNRWEYLSEYAD